MNKKTILLCLALPLLLLSCSKGYNIGEEYYNGSNPGNKNAGRSYMLQLANDLVIDNLKTLENALYADRLGAAPGEESASYDKGGKSLREKGAVWTVTYQGGLVGLVITALGEDTWRLEWDGEYDLGGNAYPTKYTLTATCLEEMQQKSHFDWAVELDGTRTEREGYSCHFWTKKTLWYEVMDRSYAGWYSCNGLLVMIVQKNGKGLDSSSLELRGTPNEAQYRRGAI